MQYRPILFSGPMVRAILGGRKTQTRRVAKLTDSGRFKQPGSSRNWHPDDPRSYKACPYGQPGDRLWVRETWASTEQAGDHAGDARYVYRATHPDWSSMDGWKWKPSIFMPRAACRLFLEITSVRAERLQDITESDARAEGVEQLPGGFFRAYKPDNPQQIAALMASISFRQLWDSINGQKFPFAANPWVWVIEFQRIEEATA